ncbi:MAG: peroxiredoxin [Sphingomonadaceae bacterium]|uniref:peroxiredoxin n=1 Tax=Thermaurantiacus sp. TaxID=2820283 RepID=UPI00298EDEFB|nr:peroxiredoxin [Thermaurantiacus sp.]MCS6986596.1 peroxiredoxin [Sphingomonadaceae bacterium]MDW8414143.1 peroxiredoxin [Thermaurantiacus sp.]
MSLRINSLAPDFEAETTHGRIRFHEWMGDSWVVLFSHPKDFTPVCTTELGRLAHLLPEFERRGVKVIGLSVDPVDHHRAWAKDIEETQGAAVTYPVIADTDLEVAKLYEMLPEDAGDTAEGRTPADNATVRTVFVIGPDRRIKAMLVYPMSTGRNFAEVLRLIDALQLTTRHPVATPVDWQPGEDVIIALSLSDEEAARRFPGGWTAPRPYLRLVPQPAER